MKLENEFTVDAPVDKAWNVMLDLERVTPCLPGAQLTEQTGDGEHKGTMRVKLGPVTQDYQGKVWFEETDESQHRAVLRADGQDARGQGTASATITSTLQEENGGDSTRVRVETEMQITGRAAQFGQGVQQDVAEKIMGQFAECLENQILGGGAEEEPSEDGAAQQEEENGGETSQQEGGGVEALDIGEMSQGAILERVKPLVPVVAGVGALFLIIWLLKRGRSGGRSEWSGGLSGEHGEIEARLRF
ncbi:MAG: SRPBCC family protein [Actinomycetota bacterium]|nr:SRPBCC family protein [Actinomycetota bacterium]MDQ3927106.1 SRPBCC family protein [Actinomycetota bacterium]